MGLLRGLSLVPLLAPGAAAMPGTVDHSLPPGALLFGQCDSPIPYAEGDDVVLFSQQLLRWREERPHLYASTPILPQSVRLIPDTAAQSELHLVYDEDPLVSPALSAIVTAAAPHGTVVLHVRDPSEQARAARLLETHGQASSRVATTAAPESIWLRDFAGHPANTSNGPARIDFRYTADCLVDDAWPVQLAEVVRVALWVDGGSLITDGDRCYVSEAVAENNSLDLTAAARALEALGCPETVWMQPMPDSISHVDPFLALGDRRSDGTMRFVLARVDKQSDPALHLALEANAARLAPYGEVLRIPVPAVRPITPQLNVLTFNGVVLVPDLGRDLDASTWQTLQRAWPERTLVPVPSAGLAVLEGGPHCVTATVPAWPSEHARLPARLVPEGSISPLQVRGP